MAHAIGNSWAAGGPQSEEAQAFWLEHGEILTEITQAIERALQRHDGTTLLLMDASLRGLISQILNGIQRTCIRFEVSGDDSENII